MVGSVSGITRSTMPTRPCWMNALTRKRPMPEGEMAKLHSLVRSNSAARLSLDGAGQRQRGWRERLGDNW